MKECIYLVRYQRDLCSLVPRQKLKVQVLISSLQEEISTDSIALIQTHKFLIVCAIHIYAKKRFVSFLGQATSIS